MATTGKRIGQMDSAAPINGSERFEMIQSGVSRQITFAALTEGVADVVTEEFDGIVLGLVPPADAPVLVDPLTVVATTSTANKADPAVVDPGLPTIADQTSRVYNAGGALSAQSPSTLGSFFVTKKYDVVAGQTYTASLHGAPFNATFYMSGVPRLDFFNTDGSFHSSLTAGWTANGGGPIPPNAVNVRDITFTVPVGAERVGFTLRDSINYSTTSPVTTAYVTTVMNNLMLNLGTTALEYVPYSTGAYAPSTALFVPQDVGDITVARQGEYTYLRMACQQSEDKHVVWRLHIGHPVDYYHVGAGRTGVMDFYGIRFISSTAGANSTIDAFNRSTLVHSGGTDECCPEKLNGMYLGAGHGVVGYEVTKAAHGMTNVDVGSIWSDGTAQWVLYFIVSTSVLMFVRRYTGSVTGKWAIGTTAPGSATMTHVSGATHTGNIAFTVPTQAQFVPIIRDHLLEIKLDDVAITTEGSFHGDDILISEIYSLMNMASQQDSLIAHVGAANPDYTAADIAEQIRIFYEYRWNKWGALSTRPGRGVKQAYTRSAGVPGDYWGAQQMQRLSLVGDSTPGMATSVHLYIPQVAPVGGYDFTNIANITANNTTVQIPITSCVDPSDPASHFCQFGRNGGGVTLSGELYGLSRRDGLGVPAVRAVSITNAMFFSNAEKQYIVAIDSAAGDAVADTAFTATAFRIPFLPTDPFLTVPGVIASVGSKHYCFVTSHLTLADKSIPVPPELNGLPVVMLKSNGNVELLDAYVVDGQISVNITNGYGDAVFEIGLQ